MSIASVIALSASVLLAAVLFGSAEGRRLVRRSGVTFADVERRHHFFSTALTFVVVMAALCAVALLILTGLLNALLAGWTWG